MSNSLFLYLALVAALGMAHAPAANAADGPQVCMTKDRVSIQDQSNPVLVYRYRDVPMKPYVAEWFTPGGINVLRDAPADHLHHHGLMFAISVEGVNFWEESAAGGIQAHQEFTETRVEADTDKPGAGFTARLAWRGPDAPDTLLLEERSIDHVEGGPEGVRLLTWRSELTAPEERDGVTLGGSSYHGLGMRFPVFMDKVGQFLMAHDKEGAFEEGPHQLAQASWCAYVVNADGKDVTVAMFSHPDNPRPALWFTMLNPFAYLSATLDLSREPMRLEKEASLALCYGVAAWDTAVEADAVQTVYEYWLGTTHD